MYYCRYSREEERSIITQWLAGSSLDADTLAKANLEPWEDDLSREAFSLEAISVLSKLSLLDEPLIIVFDQLEGLGRQQNRVLLENFGEAVKEIFTHVPNSVIVFNLFPNRWVQMRDEIFDGAIADRMSQYIIHLERPSQSSIKAILQARINVLDLQLEDFFDSQELNDILGHPSIRSVINQAAAYYRYKVHGAALPPSHSQLAKSNVVESSKPTDDDNNTTEQRLTQIETDINFLKKKLEALYLDTSDSSEDIFSDWRSEESIRVQTPDPDIDMLNTYLRDQREELENSYSKPTIIDDNDDLGKLFAITAEIKEFELFDIQELRLGKRRLPEHLLIQNSQCGKVLGLINVGGGAFAARMRNFNQLVINHSDLDFILMRDMRQNEITGQVSKSEIEKLNHTRNGKFVYLGREDRIVLDLLYQVVVDIQNRDLDISSEKAFSLIRQHQPKHWLLDALFLQS